MSSLRLLCVSIIALAATACAEKTVQVYLGPPLPRDEVSTLRADVDSSQGLAAIAIRRVNGVDTLRAKPAEIEVLPGPQIVRVELVKRENSEDAISDARSFKTVTFDAAPGRTYYVRGKMLDGIGRVWIMDDRGAMITSTEVKNTQDSN